MQPYHAVHKGLAHLITAISTLAEYNCEFSSAGLAAKQHARILESVISSNSDSSPNITNTDEEALRHAQEIFIKLQPELSAIGLVLVHNSSGQHSLSLEPHSVKNLDKFLTSLSKAEVRGAKATQAFSFLADQFETALKLQCVKRRLGLDSQNDTSLCDAAELLSEKLISLNIETDKSNSLSETLEHAWAGTLREHQIAKDASILPAPQTSGPQTWHEHLSLDEFRSKWEHAISALESISLNPAASTMASQVKSHLLTCLQNVEAYCRSLNLLKDVHERSLIEMERLLSHVEELYGKITQLDLRCS